MDYSVLKAQKHADILLGNILISQRPVGWIWGTMFVFHPDHKVVNVVKGIKDAEDGQRQWHTSHYPAPVFAQTKQVSWKDLAAEVESLRSQGYAIVFNWDEEVFCRTYYTNLVQGFVFPVESENQKVCVRWEKVWQPLGYEPSAQQQKRINQVFNRK